MRFVTSRFGGKSSNLDFTPTRRNGYRASLPTSIAPDQLPLCFHDHNASASSHRGSAKEYAHPTSYLGATTDAHQIAQTSSPHSTNATPAASFGRSPVTVPKQSTKSTCACARSDLSGQPRTERRPRRRGQRSRRCGLSWMQTNERLSV
jgi:hypothetical protein